jgi:Protein of unknown function (DUF3426)
VVEGHDATASPFGVDDTGQTFLDIEAPAATADIDVMPLEDEGAASERMAPSPRTDIADIGAATEAAEAVESAEAIEEEQLALPPAGDTAAADIRSDPGDTPSFVRQAEREARWRQPRVRAALALGCVAAGLLLAGQWMVAQRDLVAARSPGLKPMLAAACAVLGCEVRPPRSLEALRVESSGVVRVEKSDLYRLSVALRNLRPHEVALPAFELALTDTQGQLIARRVLRAGELGARVESLAAGAELTLQCTIQVAAGTVAGYTIELFYP